MTAHYVYRCFDATGDLIYVGCTREPAQRMKQHELTSFWHSQMVRVKITVYPARPTALEAERTAIRSEHPRYNITGRHGGKRANWSQADYYDYITTLSHAGNGTNIFRLLTALDQYAERWPNRPHELDEWIRATAAERKRQDDINWGRRKTKDRISSLELDASDARSMLAHMESCEPCSIAGDYADDCPEFLESLNEDGLLDFQSGAA